jgi:hypothetical protein
MPVNYQALYQLSISKDPVARQLAAQASKNMTPQEYKEFFDYQNQLHVAQGVGQETRGDRNVLGVPPEMIPLGLPGALSATGIGSKVAAMGKDIYNSGKAALPILAVGAGGKMLGLNQGTIDMLMLATGLKGGGGKNAVAEGNAATEAKVLGERTMPMSEAEYRATTGRPRNVSKTPTLSGEASDVAGGVQNDFRGPVGITGSGSGKIADQAGFDRALEAELNRITGLKGMPTGANAPYDEWVAMKDAEVAPGTVQELLPRLKASLAKDAAKRRKP